MALCCRAVSAARETKRIIIDSDAAMTVDQPQFPHPTDIDDDLAVLFALHQQRLGNLLIEGIVTTFGNANQTSTNADMINLAGQAGIDSPILQGGDFNSSLLDKTPGATFMIEQLERSKWPWNSPPTLVNIGSLYTLASVVTQSPTLVGSLGDIILLGGTTVMNRPISTNYLADLNFKADSKATNVVLGLPVRKVTLTMDLCMQVLWTDREWARLQRPQCKGSVISSRLPRVQQWMQQMGAAEFYAFHAWPQFGNATAGYVNHTGINSTIPWDTLAMLYVTNPEWFGDERCYEMQLLIQKKIIFSKEMPCDQCAASQWVYCVVVPMKILEPEAMMDSLTDSLCDVQLVDQSPTVTPL